MCKGNNIRIGSIVSLRTHAMCASEVKTQTGINRFVYTRGNHNAAREPYAAHARHCCDSLKIPLIIYGTKC
jgi:hypothetical protein